ncbi:MAG: PEP-CTERM sorting domain-containing protein [Planctomycetota bacterium]
MRLLAFVALAAIASTSPASVISVNFTNADGPRQVLPGETTGVVPDSAWLNVNLSTFDQTPGNSANTGPFVGAVPGVGGTAVDLSFTGAATGGFITTNTARDAANPDGTDGFLALYESGLRDSSTTSGDTFFTLSGLSAFLSDTNGISYDLYVYYKSAVTAAADAVDIGFNGGAVVTYDPDATGISASDPFVEAGNAESNFIAFTGLTDDSATFTLSRGATGGRDAILAGFQVVSIVPEPGSAAATCLLLLGVARRRRAA